MSATTRTTHPSPEAPPVRTARPRRWVAVALVLAILAVVFTFFLATYAVHHYKVPLGWDSPKYLWRTKLAALTGVTDLPTRLPPPVGTNPDRPGFPTLALEINSITGALPFRLAAVFPVVMAGAIGLASAALVRVALRRRVWESALVGTTVATSTFVARLMNPEAYQDNMLALAVAMAALTILADALGRVDRGRRGRLVASSVLLSSAVLLHWETTLLVAAMVGASALPFVWPWWRRRRSGPRAPTTAGAVLAVSAGAVAVGAALFYGLVRAGPQLPETSSSARAEFTAKFHSDLAVHPLWFVVPLAVVGAGALIRARRREGPSGGEGREWLLALSGTWVAVTAVATVLLLVGRPVPAHRFLTETLPLPILAGVGGLAVAGAAARWAGRGGTRSRRGVVAGGAVVAALLGFIALTGQQYWLSRRPPLNPWLIRQASSAGAYIRAAGISAERPLVFISNPRSAWRNNLALQAQQVRAALPARRITHAYFYLGDPDAYLAGRATERPTTGPPSPEYERTSRAYLRPILPLLPRYPVTLLLDAMNPDAGYFTPWVAMHPEAEVAPGVFLVRGPALSEPLPGAFAPIGRKGFIPLALTASLTVAILLVAGIGWAAAARRARGDPFPTLALAPAVGVAVMVTSGVVAERVGLSLTGVAGWAAPAAVTALGLLAAAALGRRRPS